MKFLERAHCIREDKRASGLPLGIFSCWFAFRDLCHSIYTAGKVSSKFWARLSTILHATCSSCILGQSTKIHSANTASMSSLSGTSNDDIYLLLLYSNDDICLLLLYNLLLTPAWYTHLHISYLLNSMCHSSFLLHSAVIAVLPGLDGCNCHKNQSINSCKYFLNSGQKSC